LITERVATPVTVVAHWDVSDEELRLRWSRLCEQCRQTSASHRWEWLAILRGGLRHRPVVLEALRDNKAHGMLPLAYMSSALFGRFLVSLPYLSVGGVLASDSDVAHQLIDRAVELADELDVKYLELRHEERQPHPALNYEMLEKVHMRRDLPQSATVIWKSFDPKVRNQIRKAQKEGLTVEWGQDALLHDFYSVFSRNMRCLGTPAFGRRLFADILAQLPDASEICAVRYRGRCVAAAVVIHGAGISEVPSASSLRDFNHLNGNMLMYWHLLMRSIELGQEVFDFGRSSVGSNTYRFKSQWGATPHPAVWQYYVRKGCVSDMRPNNPKNQRRIAIWKRLPVWLTRLIGPTIVRGIP
jgi:FemAB-related protein (PEP-CTERM system-associated)